MVRLVVTGGSGGVARLVERRAGLLLGSKNKATRYRIESRTRLRNLARKTTSFVKHCFRVGVSGNSFLVKRIFEQA